MRPRAYRIAWLAPLLIGASGAVAAEVAVGILLYEGPGLLRSLTTVLAVQGAALAAGLWSAPSGGGVFAVERLRRRWLFCLLTFMAAALFGTSWSVVQDLGGGPVGQGLGLAVLAALPVYACGLVLSGMNAVVAQDLTGSLRGPGAPAAMGAALGFVLTGALLPRAPIPASLLVACLVLLSAGGMIYGIVLASRPMIHLRAARRAVGSDVRVEDRVGISGNGAVRYLLEGGFARRRTSLDDNGSIPWDVVAARSLLAGKEGPTRVLFLGGGASPSPHALVTEHPHVHVEVLERNPAVVDLVREHFEQPPEPSERVSLRVGNLDDLLAEAEGPYDVVVVDTGALAPLGGVTGLSRSARSALERMVASDGALAVGPASAPASLPLAGATWPTVELRRAAPGVDTSEEVVVVRRPNGAGPWSGTMGDFLPRTGAVEAP